MILGALKEFQQCWDGLTGNGGRGGQRATFVGEAIDAAMDVVTVGVAQVALEMADQRRAPIDDVDRAIGAHGSINRPKISITRGHEISLTLTFNTGAVINEFEAIDTLETDDIRIEIISPILRREMRAGDDATPSRRPGRSVPDRF